MTSRLLPAALPLFLALGGCADVQGYPSLAPRPIEREVLRADPAPPAEPVAAAPVPLTGEVAQIVERARTAEAEFRAALEKARPLVAAGRGAAEGSDAWVAAQQAYSTAEAATAPLAEALAELDRRREAATDASDAATEAAVGQALTDLQAIYEAQRADLAALMPA